MLAEPRHATDRPPVWTWTVPAGGQQEVYFPVDYVSRNAKLKLTAVYLPLKSVSNDSFLH